MTDVGERFRVLEQHVQRAVELIERLRAENGRLAEERAGLSDRVTRLEGEQRRLQEERQALLGHVEGMLKELARIEAG